MSDEDDFFRPPPKSPIAKAVFASVLTTLVMFPILVTLQQRGLLPIGGQPARAAVEEAPVDVPPLVGMRADQARAALNGLGLLLVLAGERDSAQYAQGTIAEQAPLPGSQVKKGTPVQAFVSRGQRQVKVPELVGQKSEDAERQLTAAGLALGARKTAASETVAEGSVIATEPAAGTALTSGGVVALVVSSGGTTKGLPKVIGLRLRAARELLEEQGFKVGKLRYDSNGDRPLGVILDQRPAADSPSAPGTAVDITVNEE